MQTLDRLIPIFAVIGLGIILRRSGFFTDEITSGFNRFAYFFALPLFLFFKLGNAPGVGQTANDYIVTLTVATLATGLLCWIATMVFGVAPRSRGALIQASFRGNLAFLGLPLILFMIADAAEGTAEGLESAVLIALPPIVILYNVASVAVLAIFGTSDGAGFSWKKLALNIATNPLLGACLLGVAVQAAGIPIPTSINRTCEIVGTSAFPIALLGIGSQLAVTKVHDQWFNILLAAFFKCVLCPAIGWATATWLGLEGQARLAIVVLSAVPTAVSSFVLADQMNGDRELAAGAVVACTAISFVTLSVILFIVG